MIRAHYYNSARGYERHEGFRFKRITMQIVTHRFAMLFAEVENSPTLSVLQYLTVGCVTKLKELDEGFNARLYSIPIRNWLPKESAFFQTNSRRLEIFANRQLPLRFFVI